MDVPVAQKPHKPNYPIKPYKVTLRRLERELVKKQEEWQRLSEQNSILKLRESILTAYSLSLQWLRDHAAVAAVSGGDSLASAFSHDDSGEELQLLDQLQGLAIEPGLLHRHVAVSGDSTCSIPAASCTQEQQPVAPEDNPLVLMRHVCTLPPFPGAAEMSVEQVAAQYSSSVQQLALQLSLYKAEQQLPAGLQFSNQECNSPLQRMQDCLLRFLWLRASLAFAGRSDAVRAQYITSCEDLSQQLLEPSIEQHVRALVLLEVSQKQLHRLAGGHTVFQDILRQSVIQEMHKEVQQRQQEYEQHQQSASARCGSSSTTTSSSSGGSGGKRGSAHVQRHNSQGRDGSQSLVLPACSEAAAAASAHVANREGLWQQEDFTKRLITLLKTDTRARTAATAYCFGTLTWPQLCELHVLLYPFAPHPGILMRAAVTRLQQLQQES